MLNVGETLSAVRSAVASGAHTVWVAQLAECWFVDPADQDIADRAELGAWRDERSAIDSALLAALVDRRVQFVRRAVLFDISSDAGERLSRPGADPIAVHQRVFRELASWKQELARYVALFDDGTADHPVELTTATLSVQEVILGRVASGDDVDARVLNAAFDGCVATFDRQVPDSWREMSRMISMRASLGLPTEDANPLSAIPSLELLEYRRR